MTYRIQKAIPYVFLISFTLAVIYPLYLLLINSVKPISDFYQNSIGFPVKMDFSSFRHAFNKADFIHAFPNSLYVLLVSELGLVLFGLMAAYPIARIKLRFNQVVLRVFIAGLVVPTQVLAIPLFVELKKMHLMNTLTGVSLVFIATLLPLSIFVYNGFLKGIPNELEEAAYVEGCSKWQMFIRVIVPLASPATATVIILTSLDIWNNFFYPLVFLLNQDKMTLSVSLFSFKNFQSVQWPDLFAAMTMMLLPIVVIYLFMQRYFINGIYGGAVKG